MTAQRTDPRTDSATAPGRTKPDRLPSLTGLRFVAALLVFATHILYYTPLIPAATAETLRGAFTLSGSYGVGFFFILSGFVLTWTARRNDTTTSFWRRRLVKIGPMHLVTFALAAILVLSTDRPTRAIDWITSLTLQQTWIPSIQMNSAVNGISWSLACEFFFYLSFPVLWYFLRRIREGWLWPALGGVVALIVGAFLVATYFVNDQPRLPVFGVDGEASYTQVWFVYFFPPVRLLEFVLGILLARIVLAGRWPRIGLVPAGLIAVAGYLAAIRMPYLAGSAGLATMWTAPLIAAAAVADERRAASPFRSRPLVFLGEISFAFYMVHWIILVTFTELVGPTRTFSPVAGWLLVPVLLAVIIVCSTILYRLVEVPLVQRLGRHRPDSNRAGATPAAGLH